MQLVGVVHGALQLPEPQLREVSHSESLVQVTQSWLGRQRPLRQSEPLRQPRTHAPCVEQYVPASQVSFDGWHCTQRFREVSQNGVPEEVQCWLVRQSAQPPSVRH